MIISAVVVLLYGAAVAVGVPPILCRLTARGIGARLGLAAWLVAMASVLAAVAAGLILLTNPGIVVGGAHRAGTVELWLCVVASTALATVAVLMWQYARTLERARRSTRAHAEAARIIGRRVPAVDAVVLDAEQPVAYCLPGRPPTIVVSGAALDVLDGAQLSAVLAHERAHLAGRHHLLVALTRGLATLFPVVSVFGRGAGEVARLTEMCADDVAARHADRRVLVAALIAMGTGAVVPPAVLGATGAAVLTRVRRLVEPPPPRGVVAGVYLALIGVMLGLVVGLALVVSFAAGLSGSGIG